MSEEDVDDDGQSNAELSPSDSEDDSFASKKKRAQWAKARAVVAANQPMPAAGQLAVATGLLPTRSALPTPT